MADEPRFPLETPVRLSRSVLWRLQRRYYERRGMAAWSEGEVPHWATSNPSIARAYGQVVLSFLHDWQAQIDRAQPVYIVELGAGAGRLAFQFLHHVEPLLRGFDVRYVMTDLAEQNLAAWRAHPALQGWLDDGRLDIARFDVEADAAITLERSGATLAPGAVRNPMIVFANYLFDSLPVDAFSVVDGGLHEWLVSLCSMRPDTDLDDPGILARSALSCTRRPVDPGPYHGDAVLDRILDEHRRLSGTSFAFPSASIACLARLSALAGGRLLVLTTDKGDVDEDALRGQPGPRLTLHGSFSVAVNYHALARFVVHQGGQALLPAERPQSIATCAFVLGAPPGGHRATRDAYDLMLDDLRLDDRLAAKQRMEHASSALTLAELTSYLLLTSCDPQIVGDHVPALIPLVAAASADDRAAVLGILVRAWDGYFHIGEPTDLGRALGTLASALEAWPEAINFFEGSLRWHGRTAPTLAALATCHHQRGQRAAAHAVLAEALAIDPTCEPARALHAILSVSPG